METLQDRLRNQVDECHASMGQLWVAKLFTEAADRINALEAHNMALLADVQDCQQQSRDYQAANHAIKSQMAELEAQVAALAKDAERYRWLREQANIELHSDGSTWTKNGVQFVASHRLCSGSTAHGHYTTLDETIDAAMQKGTTCPLQN